jgi:hypothetical protein
MWVALGRPVAAQAKAGCNLLCEEFLERRSRLALVIVGRSFRYQEARANTLDVPKVMDRNR